MKRIKLEHWLKGSFSGLRHIIAWILCSFMLVVCVYSPEAYAQDAVPGDSCSTDNSYAISGAAENSGTVYTMVCNSGTWERITESSASGYLGVKQASPQAPLHVGGEIIIGPNEQPCSGDIEGALMYNSTTKTVDVCDGTSWGGVGHLCDETVDDFDFIDVYGAKFDHNEASDIVQITGITCPVDISITGDGDPEFRICNTDECSSPYIRSYDNAATTISNGQYVQLRLRAASGNNISRTATITIGGVSDTFTVTTLDIGPYKNVFLARSSVQGDFGGVAYADNACQTRATSEGLSGTYYAWLATDATDDPATRFTQASIPYVEIGGNILAYNWDDLTDSVTDGSITNNVDGTGGYSCSYWTNVDGDGTVKSTTDNCNNWTSNSSSDRGWYGSSNDWTDQGRTDCDNNRCFVCIEQ